MTNLLVNIDVDDLETGVDFYVRALGLTPGRRLGPDGRELLGAPPTITRAQALPCPMAHFTVV